MERLAVVLLKGSLQHADQLLLSKVLLQTTKMRAAVNKANRFLSAQPGYPVELSLEDVLDILELNISKTNQLIKTL